MSDETPNTETAVTASDQDEVITDEPQGEKENTDWKEQARKWESRAKADRDAAAKWREFELSQKSDIEKMNDELAQARTAASEASVKLARYEVATRKGIPAEAIDLLVGTSVDEMEATADKLLSLMAEQSKPTAPKLDLNQGKSSANGVSTADQFASALSNIL